MFLADGFEDIEALGTRDILNRGGVDVITVSITDETEVTSAHGLTVLADTTLSEVLVDGNSAADSNDIMIFPGGMPGSKNLGECHELIAAMNGHYSQGGSVAAICAAPKFVLGQLDGIQDATFTCYDGCEDELVALGARFVKKPAVSCGRIITGRGPGHAIDFGIEILRMLRGEAAARSVASGAILPCE